MADLMVARYLRAGRDGAGGVKRWALRALAVVESEGVHCCGSGAGVPVVVVDDGAEEGCDDTPGRLRTSEEG